MRLHHSKFVQSDGFSGFWPELFQVRLSRGTTSGPRPRVRPKASADWPPPGSSGSFPGPAVSADGRPLPELPEGASKNSFGLLCKPTLFTARLSGAESLKPIGHVDRSFGLGAELFSSYCRGLMSSLLSMVPW